MLRMLDFWGAPPVSLSGLDGNTTYIAARDTRSSIKEHMDWDGMNERYSRKAVHRCFRYKDLAAVIKAVIKGACVDLDITPHGTQWQCSCGIRDTAATDRKGRFAFIVRGCMSPVKSSVEAAVDHSLRDLFQMRVYNTSSVTKAYRERMAQVAERVATLVEQEGLPAVPETEDVSAGGPFDWDPESVEGENTGNAIVSFGVVQTADDAVKAAAAADEEHQAAARAANDSLAAVADRSVADAQGKGAAVVAGKRKVDAEYAAEAEVTTYLDQVTEQQQQQQDEDDGPTLLDVPPAPRHRVQYPPFAVYFPSGEVPDYLLKLEEEERKEIEAENKLLRGF